MTTAPVEDLYPTLGTSEVTVPRQDPVVWGSPDTPGPVFGRRPARVRA